MHTLTGLQQRFVDEYLIDLNATRAYKAAGYAVKSDNAAAVNAHKLLKTAKVARAIAEAKAERSKRTQIDADWLLQRLAEEAEADIADILNDDGGLKPVHQWPPVWRKGLVQGFDVEQRYTYVDGQKEPDGVIVKVRLSDRVKRLELIGKHIDVQAFKDQIAAPPGSINLVVNRPSGD